MIDFVRRPETYRHWRIDIDGPVATLTLAIDPEGGLEPGYQLKLNSYDLGVDIELRDAVERLRFEHPEVHAVVIRSALDKVFCSGANIQMLANASHHHKVNFCKFTNETRNGVEEATEHSGQVYLAAVNGTAAGGGYELALACDEIVLIDDRASAVSLPEVPLLAVLPGTGGLTRLVDKRFVRRDRADVFASRAEGMRGIQAQQWGLVDHLATPSNFDAFVRERAEARAAESSRPSQGPGVELTDVERTIDGDTIEYSTVQIRIDRARAAADLTLRGPSEPQPETPDALLDRGAGAWMIAAARDLDDALLHLRFNEAELASIVLYTSGSHDAVYAMDDFLSAFAHDDWLAREVKLLWGRVLKRLDLTAKTIVTLVEPGSCYAGTLAELIFAADRSLMLLASPDVDPAQAMIVLGPANDGWYPMSNGLSRLQARYWGHPRGLEEVRDSFGKPILAADAEDLGLVTAAFDDIDWEDEVRLLLEERASFSPDALTGLEANLRFVGPETMETKIFARLTAWQNWIFQRPNASGPEGALRRYGSGARPDFDRRRT